VITRLIPKVFYDTMAEGLDLFVDGLGFTVMHNDGSLAVVERDGAKAYIVESPEYAAKDRPEIALETDDIDAMYAEISTRRPDLLHPNSHRVALKPWGAKEFALLDRSTVCIVFRQW
jgi:hypothetical protein